MERVTPVILARVKRGPGLSRGVKALASAAVERREASGPRWDRRRARARFGGNTDRVARLQDIAPSGAPPPFVFLREVFLSRLGMTRARSRRENGSSLGAELKPARGQ